MAGSEHTTVERSATTGFGSIVAPLPADHGRSPQYWPVSLPDVLIREIVAPAVVIAAATVANDPGVAGVGPVATSAATPLVVPAAPPVTLRPVVVVETPAAVTAAPSAPVVEQVVIERPAVVGRAAAVPVVMTSAVFALAVASGLAAAPVRSADAAPTEPAAGGAPIAGCSVGNGPPPALADSSSPTPAPADPSAPAEPLQTAAGPQLPGPPSSPPEVPDAQAGPDQGAGAGPITGGTAGDADAQALSAPSTPDATPPLTVGTAAGAAAAALQTRPSVGAETAPLVPPIAIGSTVAFETAAASTDSTDAAAALQLARALDASGKGFHSVSWREDERSNAAVLRLGAAEAWSRHEKERAELFGDARSASAGLRAQTGFDRLLVRQLVGGD